MVWMAAIPVDVRSEWLCLAGCPFLGLASQGGSVTVLLRENASLMISSKAPQIRRFVPSPLTVLCPSRPA